MLFRLASSTATKSVRRWTVHPASVSLVYGQFRPGGYPRIQAHGLVGKRYCTAVDTELQKQPQLNDKQVTDKFLAAAKNCLKYFSMATTMRAFLTYTRVSLGYAVLPLAITATGVAFGMAKGSVLPCIGIFMVCSAIGQWKGVRQFFQNPSNNILTPFCSLFQTIDPKRMKEIMDKIKDKMGNVPYFVKIILNLTFSSLLPGIDWAALEKQEQSDKMVSVFVTGHVVKVLDNIGGRYDYFLWALLAMNFVLAFFDQLEKKLRSLKIEDKPEDKLQTSSPNPEETAKQ